MKTHRMQSAAWVVALILASGPGLATLFAGMPSPLPTNWTAQNTPEWMADEVAGQSPATALRVQAISFFLVVLLFSGGVVQRLWNFARRDFPRLPVLTFGRALVFVGLWGLSFVIVLTMISGARELMTPGAWRKQGWTYALSEQRPSDETGGRVMRRLQMEKLRTALWQHAATHNGRLPGPDARAIDASLWEIPGLPGLKYLAVPNRRAAATGRLVVFEPAFDDGDRFVLLSNGLIGSMTTAMIDQSLAEARAEQTAASTASTLTAQTSAESEHDDGSNPEVEGGTP